ncbi:glycosyltransferase [Paenibacillus cymbidii]|uniref:glycosyltransferase n=1 Tax=Paenibacillus cymbidii TaxID=1639034 RepID=UPI00108107A6|nr:glycosyltransferase [Paenibacillus cymbidii]
MQLSLICPIFDASGYAEAARTLVLGFLDQGHEIRIIPKDWSQADSGLPPAVEQRLRAVCGNELLPVGPVLHLTIAQNFRYVPGRLNIGMTMIECNRLPHHWVERCNEMDQVWVPSTFNRTSFIDSGVHAEKIKVVPIGIDPARFHPNVAPIALQHQTKGRFVFISNFEWVERKGYDILIRAYLEEFTNDDPVLLVIKSYDGSNYDPHGVKLHQYYQDTMTQIRKSNPPAMEFVTRNIRYEEMPSFYTAGSCYVIATRGEGWNLPALEAMSSGIPVITTNWSAHLDFLHERNSYLIDIDRLAPVPMLGVPNDEIYRGACWAEPSLPDTKRRLRHAFQHPLEVSAKGKRARFDAQAIWNQNRMLRQAYRNLTGMSG